MTASSTKPALGALAFFGIAFTLATYFTFAAVQGDYGLFRRVEILAEKQQLEAELALAQAEVAHMENLTRRLSDSYLDLDLLDQQARDVLGMIRADELVIR
ncbi:MAG: septum formation initiator family protein [Shimia sp.]|uniref:FtsB family cell division protein n=1 Tax=unclassified Shimia TaxID=2630038 RepID=UPI0025ECD9F6|nr:septum formation initiator family protein [uncultured Shimia sp.]